MRLGLASDPLHARRLKIVVDSHAIYLYLSFLDGADGIQTTLTNCEGDDSDQNDNHEHP